MCFSPVISAVFNFSDHVYSILKHFLQPCLLFWPSLFSTTLIFLRHFLEPCLIFRAWLSLYKNKNESHDSSFWHLSRDREVPCWMHLSNHNQLVREGSVRQIFESGVAAIQKWYVAHKREGSHCIRHMSNFDLLRLQTVCAHLHIALYGKVWLVKKVPTLRALIRDPRKELCNEPPLGLSGLLHPNPVMASI